MTGAGVSTTRAPATRTSGNYFATTTCRTTHLPTTPGSRGTSAKNSYCHVHEVFHEYEGSWTRGSTQTWRQEARFSIPETTIARYKLIFFCDRLALYNCLTQMMMGARGRDHIKTVVRELHCTGCHFEKKLSSRGLNMSTKLGHATGRIIPCRPR